MHFSMPDTYMFLCLDTQTVACVKQAGGRCIVCTLWEIMCCQGTPGSEYWNTLHMPRGHSQTIFRNTQNRIWTCNAWMEMDLSASWWQHLFLFCLDRYSSRESTLSHSLQAMNCTLILRSALLCGMMQSLWSHLFISGSRELNIRESVLWQTVIFQIRHLHNVFWWTNVKRCCFACPTCIVGLVYLPWLCTPPAVSVTPSGDFICWTNGVSANLHGKVLDVLDGLLDPDEEFGPFCVAFFCQFGVFFLGI